VKVLVKEQIAESGIDMLREQFEVELGFDMDDEELARRIGEFDAILIRSATTMTPELIGKADRMKVIGRAGTGVDNVDIPAATKRGIIVANAPESNSVAAAEHTLALALALFRNVPQAHSSLTAGRWDRSKYKGSELYGKTLGILGFGRIGQLVAKRAQSFEMDVVAFDKFVSADRFADLGVEGVETPEELYGRADLITIHLPKTPETVGWIDGEAIAAMKDGVRIVNCARGELIDLDALIEGLDSGRIAGAALDVFPEEPFTEHPIFQRDDVVVTPHLGASTAEAQDRAGVDTAEQVTAALSGGVVTNAVNIPAVDPTTMKALAPWIPLCEKLGKVASGISLGSIGKIEVEFRGGVAANDTRLLGVAVLAGVLSGHTVEAVNLVNAPQMAEDRGIEISETNSSESGDFTDLIRVTIGSGDEMVSVGGTTVGPRQIPHLVSLWDEDFYLPFEPHMAVLRYSDRPGMIGTVGTVFGDAGVNIGSAAVGAESDGERAVMVVTADAPLGEETISGITALDGFIAGYALEL
jgi:D-3-phosphoglycerate dehydrogenase